MAAANSNTPAPDQVALFNISLQDIELSAMVDLSEQQQRRQMTEPFECFGIHWLLTIEKEPPPNGGNGFNILVCLYCLSVQVVEETNREKFPLKGNITLQDDGQVRIFNAQVGQAFNLVGKPFPAHAVRMSRFTLTLRSGMTERTEVEVSMYGEEGLGGYYGSDRRGAGGVLLENHVFDSVRDGAAIEVTLRFEGQPRALRFVDQDD